MRHCPICGDKDFDASHKGSYTKTPCADCAKSGMKKGMAKIPAVASGLADPMPAKSKPPIAKAIKGKPAKKNFLFGA